jgi:hypothetical protein
MMQQDGFNPDDSGEVSLWRKYVAKTRVNIARPNMGLPGGPTGGGVVARGQIARGPAPPILIVKPGVGRDTTIPTAGGFANVRYSQPGADSTAPGFAGSVDVKYNEPGSGKWLGSGLAWPIGEDKAFNYDDHTTYGKPGVQFNPMRSATWSDGYIKDFYSRPGYIDIKTSDRDLSTPIGFGNERRVAPELTEREALAAGEKPLYTTEKGDYKVDDRDKIQPFYNAGGLIRRYFAGGLVGMQGGGFVPAPDMGGPITAAALKDLSARLSEGVHPGSSSGSIASIWNDPSYGGPFTASAGAFSGLNTLGVHQLDLRTNAGNFSAAVSEQTMDAIRNSSLMAKISSAGNRPTWYS